jgi:hypothetical protein
MKLEVLFAAAIQIANQLLIAPQSGCTEFSIAATSSPSATVQYTDCNTGESKSIVVPNGSTWYRCARTGTVSTTSGTSTNTSLGACYPKVQIYSGLTVNNYLSIGGVQVLNGTGNWLGPGTNIIGAQTVLLTLKFKVQVKGLT